MFKRGRVLAEITDPHRDVRKKIEKMLKKSMVFNAAWRFSFGRLRLLQSPESETHFGRENRQFFNGIRSKKPGPEVDTK